MFPGIPTYLQIRRCSSASPSRAFSTHEKPSSPIAPPPDCTLSGSPPRSSDLFPTSWSAAASACFIVTLLRSRTVTFGPVVVPPIIFLVPFSLRFLKMDDTERPDYRSVESVSGTLRQCPRRRQRTCLRKEGMTRVLFGIVYKIIVHNMQNGGLKHRDK